MPHWIHVSRSHLHAPGQARLQSVYKGTCWKQGKYCLWLTKALARHLSIPTDWVILTNSCTSALTAAHRFFTDHYSGPRLTYAAAPATARLLNYEVRELDVDENGWPLHSEVTQHGLTTAVELWGRALPFGYDSFPILDAAHRFGAPEHQEMFANEKQVVCYSFGPMKELCAPAGGAMISKAFAGPLGDEVRAFLQYGQQRRYPTEEAGINGYMVEPNACVVLNQLRRHEKNVAIRQRILKTYQNFLGELLVTPPGSSGHLAVARLPDRGSANRVKFRFSRVGWEYGIHYPVLQKYEGTGAYTLSKRILTLPCHILMQPVQAARIARVVLTA